MRGALECPQLRHKAGHPREWKMRQQDDLFGGPSKTPEERAKEIEQFAEFIELMTWRPLMLILRWPLWPTIERARKRFHDSASYGELRELFFNLLRTGGFICQLLIVWTLCRNSVLAKQLAMPDTTTLAWLLAAFGVLTIIRIYFWMQDNLST